MPHVACHLEFGRHLRKLAGLDAHCEATRGGEPEVSDMPGANLETAWIGKTGSRGPDAGPLAPQTGSKAWHRMASDLE